MHLNVLLYHLCDLKQLICIKYYIFFILNVIVNFFMSVLEKKHDMIYIINLENRDDRWMHMQKTLKHMGITKYTRFFAINGRRPDIYSYWYKQLITHKHYKIKSAGAYGYLLTYYYLLQDAMKKGYKSILVMDDDVLIHKNYNQIIEQIVEQIPDDFKLIYYGCCHQNHRTTSSIVDNNIIDMNCNVYNVHNFLRRFGHGNIDGSHMLGISSSIYMELINTIPKTIYPVDSGILKDIYLKNQMCCYVIYPCIAIQNMEESDIQNGVTGNNNKQNKLIHEWGWNINNYLQL